MPCSGQNCCYLKLFKTFDNGLYNLSANLKVIALDAMMKYLSRAIWRKIEKAVARNIWKKKKSLAFRNSLNFKRKGWKQGGNILTVTPAPWCSHRLTHVHNYITWAMWYLWTPVSYRIQGRESGVLIGWIRMFLSFEQSSTVRQQPFYFCIVPVFLFNSSVNWYYCNGFNLL